MESRVNNDNFIMIQGWMVNELKLKGNDLMVYAIIYGFSQAENQCYNGSLQYLADWCGSSKQGIMKNLKSLLEKKLIVKEEIIKNNVKFCEYRAIRNHTVNKPKPKISKRPSNMNGIERNYSDEFWDTLYVNQTLN